MMKIIRRKFLSWAASVPLLIAVGVGLSVAPASASSDLLYGKTDPAAKSGGTLNVGTLIEPPTMDIYHGAGEAISMVALLMYQTLVYPDHEGEPLPLLAESWDISDDASVYTFKLRDGITFHNGQPLEAEDVKYSMDYMRNAENGTVGVRDMSDVTNIEVLDRLTVRFTLAASNSGFLITLTHRNASILPRNFFDDEGAKASMNITSAGTGPYILDKFERNSYMRLKRNPNYWQDNVALLDEIVFHFIPNSAAMLVAVKNGRVDLAVLVRPQDAKQLENVAGLSIQRSMSQNNKAVDLGGEHPILKDIRVRQAIAKLIDKKTVMQAAIGGYGTVLGTMVPGMQERWGVPIKDLANQTLDIEGAKALLAEAGYADGFEIDLTTIITYDWMEPAALTIAQQLSKANIKVNIKRLELGAWLKNLLAKGMGFTLNDYGTPPDPNMLFYRHFHQPPGGADWRNWDNTRGSELLDEGRQALTYEKRRATYSEFQKLLAETVPTIMLFGADHLIVLSDKVKNHTMHPVGWHFGLAKTWVDK